MPPKKRTTKRAAPRATQRADLGTPADSYFVRIARALNPIARRLRAIVRAAAPKASETIKWGMPVYEHNGLLCYIRARPSYITLGFYEHGVFLSDPKGRLEGSGESMRHIKVATATQIDSALFTKWVKQAAALNNAS